MTSFVLVQCILAVQNNNIVVTVIVIIINTNYVPFFQKMMFFQDAMDDLKDSLVRAEAEKDRWQPVADILIENLQHEIEKTKVKMILLSVQALKYKCS